MHGFKMKVYSKLFKKLWGKHHGGKDFINERTEEICSHEKLSAEGYFVFTVYVFLLGAFSIIIVPSYECK